jgi:hypothetical protein
MNIRFTATADEYDTRLFKTEDDFIAFLDTLWGHHGGYPHDRSKRIQHRVLRDPEPLRYPCVMLSAGQNELYNGQDEIHNIFLYDVVIHDEDDEEDLAEAA